ncbi:hypothetical protein D3C81_1121840 [compost metagenome]
MQLDLGIAGSAEAAHGLDTQGNDIAGGQRADIGDIQPLHHLRFLRAPGQLGAIRVAQAPTVTGEVTVQNLVCQLAEGQRGVSLSILDACLQGAQLALGQRQQQRALGIEQAGELVDQESLAGSSETLHRNRLVDT